MRFNRTPVAALAVAGAASVGLLATPAPAIPPPTGYPYLALPPGQECEGWQIQNGSARCAQVAGQTSPGGLTGGPLVSSPPQRVRQPTSARSIGGPVPAGAPRCRLAVSNPKVAKREKRRHKRVRRLKALAVMDCRHVPYTRDLITGIRMVTCWYVRSPGSRGWELLDRSCRTKNEWGPFALQRVYLSCQRTGASKPAALRYRVSVVAGPLDWWVDRLYTLGDTSPQRTFRCFPPGNPDLVRP